MTEDEKRRQKADLLLEYEEAEQSVAHLREKATRIATRIEAVSRWLLNAAGNNDTFSDRVYVSTAGSELFEVPTNAQIPPAMDFSEAVKLVNEIRAGIRRVQELKQRKAALGLR